MNIQIFGTKKCKDTAKALRFFKERKVEPHFVNLAEKPVSRGELTSIAARIPLEELIDRANRVKDSTGLNLLPTIPRLQATDKLIHNHLVI